MKKLHSYFISFESKNYFVSSLEVAAYDKEQAEALAKERMGGSWISLKCIHDRGEITPGVTNVIDNF